MWNLHPFVRLFPVNWLSDMTYWFDLPNILDITISPIALPNRRESDMNRSTLDQTLERTYTKKKNYPDTGDGYQYRYP